MIRILYFCFLIPLLWSCGGDAGEGSAAQTLVFREVAYERQYKFDREIGTDMDTSKVPWRFQLAATAYAEKGSYWKALEAWDLGYPGGIVNYEDSGQDSALFFSIFKAVDAVEYLVERAKDYRIFILNEAHHIPKSRSFARKLLQGLKAQGYGHIGFETLNEGDSLLNERGYPLQFSGVYSRDPQFGNLIREALALGFEVFAYEALAAASGKEREVGQARNVERYFNAHPGSKIMLFCGYAHAYKGAVNKWEKALAGWLMEYTGLDVYAVEQSIMREGVSKGKENRDYRFQNHQQPVVCVDSAGFSFRPEKVVTQIDAAVVHDRTRLVDGRPHWIFGDGFKRVELDLSKSSPGVSFPCLVGAFHAEEVEAEGGYERLVPADLYEADAKGMLYLALKPGVYKILLVGETKSVEFDWVVE